MGSKSASHSGILLSKSVQSGTISPKNNAKKRCHWQKKKCSCFWQYGSSSFNDFVWWSIPKVESVPEIYFKISIVCSRSPNSPNLIDDNVNVLQVQRREMLHNINTPWRGIVVACRPAPLCRPSIPLSLWPSKLPATPWSQMILSTHCNAMFETFRVEIRCGWFTKVSKRLKLTLKLLSIHYKGEKS